MKLLPKDPGDINVRAAQSGSQKAAELGLTTIHDIFLSADEIRGYQDADFRGWLKIRRRCRRKSRAWPMPSWRRRRYRLRR